MQEFLQMKKNNVNDLKKISTSEVTLIFKTVEK